MVIHPLGSHFSLDINSILDFEFLWTEWLGMTVIRLTPYAIYHIQITTQEQIR